MRTSSRHATWRSSPLGRLPEGAKSLQVAKDLAARLHDYLRGRRMLMAEAALGLAVSHANRLRYAAPTGTVLIRWDGARQPTIWTVPAPGVDPREARLELARRYLNIFGPTAPASFAEWAGIGPAEGRAAFEALVGSLVAVTTPLGDGWILADDEPAFRTPVAHTAPARLLPSGDAYFLLQGPDRELLVPEPDRRRLLWTSRVWPGAVLVGGEIVGTWRRAEARLTIQPWRRLSRQERDAVETEATSLPLPGVGGRILTRWET